ncbi:MAG: flagellar FliJ family protein [Nitrospinota bacterium]|nr:flagellar FliJ family protein [Nitrospinota bacterium]MEC8957236.1 flagellar FliJ family protein [Nitrospinota bacterium]MED5353936.1 flagellar FliJ family protein [Nitrospinota bacterium]
MSFRFETILRLNKNKEELLQKDMGQINALIQQQKDSKNFIHEVMENKKHELNQKKRTNVNLETMILYDNFFQGTDIHKKRQDTIISEITVKMEEKREEVIDAMRKRKTLEILKEHHILKKRKLQKKKDLSTQDEIASNLWERNF